MKRFTAITALVLQHHQSSFLMSDSEPKVKQPASGSETDSEPEADKKCHCGGPYGHSWAPTWDCIPGGYPESETQNPEDTPVYVRTPRRQQGILVCN